MASNSIRRWNQETGLGDRLEECGSLNVAKTPERMHV